jgi:hypothetical protein
VSAHGSRNGRWNTGRLISSQGYILIRVGKGHPLADVRGYAYEHALVWTAAHGPIPAGYLVHHKNEDKGDNRLSNLRLKTVAEHSRLHARAAARDRVGRFHRRAA